MASQSPPKRAKISHESESESRDVATDEIEWLRELKRGFDCNFTAADQLLNRLPDPESRTEMWQQMTSMSSSFLQLVSQMTTLVTKGRAQDLNKIQSQEEVLEEQEKRVLELEKEVKRLRRQLFPTEGTPIECFQHIISFCDLMHVFRGCSQVNREWNVAAKADLKARKKVVIRCSLTYDNGKDEAFVHEKHMMGSDIERKMIAELLSKSLMQMTGVTQVCISDPESDLIIALVPFLKNVSGSLLSLEMSECSFPRGLSFPRLKRLNYSSGLKGISARATTHLSLNQVQKLNIKIKPSPALIDWLCGLKSLTHLSLDIGSTDAHDVAAGYVVQMLRAFEHLTEFSLNDCSYTTSAGQVDPAVDDLVRRNPNLEIVSLRTVRMSSTALNALSRLTSLKNLNIVSPAKSFVYHALLNLLNRGLEHKLQEVSITGVDMNQQQTRTINDLIAVRGIKCLINQGTSQ